jgi:hypothetical protein
MNEQRLDVESVRKGLLPKKSFGDLVTQEVMIAGHHLPRVGPPMVVTLE